ncbi:MAG: alkaline phosphatase [Gemmatimonadales bacterium]
METSLGRRAFVGGLSFGALALIDPAGLHRLLRLRARAYPFALGVASGDPAADGFVLWTRLAPDPLSDGGMPPSPVEVRWEVAADEGMSRVVRRGTAAAHPDLAHSVHVEVQGLDPDRWYWYRFMAGGEASPVGRSRTMPKAGTAPDQFPFAFVSCQHYEQGLYTAYEHLAREDLRLVAHLGDYIYEDGAIAGRVRRHGDHEIVTLADYRARYALYKTDPALQAAHQSVPWVLTWDDHEVDNNYAGEHSEADAPVAEFLRRRAAAYQAYYEHQPVRASARPRGPEARLFRTIDVGTLARFFVLDTRQYRTDQPCGDRQKEPCAGTYDPAATMMGATQERWLFDGLAANRARWNVVAQQVLFSRLDSEPGPAERYNMDNWNGYQAARKRAIDAIAERGRGSTVVLTGDIHSNWACDIKRNFAEPTSDTIGVELVGTSISSGGDGVDAFPNSDATLAENPHIKFTNSRRGYVRCRFDQKQWLADYRVVPYVTRPGAPISTARSFRIEAGRPGLEDA